MLTYTVCIYLDICAESEFRTKHFGTYTPHNIKGRATNSVKNNRGSRGGGVVVGVEGVIQCSPCPWSIRLGGLCFCRSLVLVGGGVVKINKRKIVAPLFK
jgi:hypothetical protein